MIALNPSRVESEQHRGLRTFAGLEHSIALHEEAFVEDVRAGRG